MSKQNGFKLSRRKALASLGAVGVASAGAGLGTSAYFSDTESFENNAITAGELDLKVDWQQLYWGMPYDHDQAPYGSAGRPFVNAHPDHDGDGMQSLNLDNFDEGDFESNDEVVRYVEGDPGDDNSWSMEDVESGANIQQYLTCETLENFDDPASFENDNEEYDPESLIHLEDVKPGDCGEVTFSYHLCDNPGYVWMLADLVEGTDEALAEAIQVNLWYDLNCNNVYNSSQDLYVFSQGSLSDLLTELESGLQLDPTAYDIDPSTADSDSTDNSGDGGVRVGKVDVNEDGTLGGIAGGSEIDDNTVNFDHTADAPTWSDVDTYESRDVTVEIEFTEFKQSGSEPISFEASVTDDNPEYGISGVRVKGGGDPDSESSFDEQHVFGEDNEDCVVNTGEVETDIRNPQNDKKTAISNIQFIVSDLDADDTPAPNPCFPAGNTFCVGFNWCLPVDVDVEGISGIDDINDLQGLSASFDLGFYTEQCRHNGSPDGPPSGT